MSVLRELCLHIHVFQILYLIYFLPIPYSKSGIHKKDSIMELVQNIIGLGEIHVHLMP